MLSAELKYLRTAVLLLSVFTAINFSLRATPLRFKARFHTEEFPEPRFANQVLYLQRDPNINTVVYELNFRNKQLDNDNPIHPFWIRYAEKGQREELSFIQRKFAFGITSRPIGNGSYEVHVASYKKYMLYLMKDVKGNYHIYCSINNRQSILERIYIHINGGSFFSPNILYIELKGINVATGKEEVQQFKP